MAFDITRRRPFTNSDVIHNMGVNELAKVIMCPREIMGTLSCECKEPCNDCALNWLLSPYDKESWGDNDVY